MSDRLLVIVGEAPGPHGDPSAVLEGTAGRRLAEYAGITVEEYLARTERYNLLPEDPGESWPGGTARLAAHDLVDQLVDGDPLRMILLGRRVAKAFGYGPSASVLGWTVWAGGVFSTALVPHPSGLNRWWNEPENRAAARRFLEAAFA